MRLRELFIEALQKETAAERVAFLVAECGDDAELRRCVDQLLVEHERQGTFLLDKPPPGVGSWFTVGAAAPGTRIGVYTLREQVAEGGMGVVFRAEQSEPVARQVALKIIKPGMDTQQVLARFEAERQALALMDHPNIARVLDAGATATGHPYFVMEFVDGQPIAKYCDDKQLDIRQRLELMIPVCQAIQHAHQKGIIHRDIKPSNILVAEYDGRPVPKVIDFGVSKAIAQELTKQSVFTLHGQIIGTLEYMSPEQAGLSQQDVDTRSDVYSLGVLLYELLIGTTPFDKHVLQAAAFHEVLRIIREEEPVRPSSRLSRGHVGKHGSQAALSVRRDSTTVSDTQADATPAPTTSLASIAAVRRTEPARLAKTIRGELDWIVMKALEKDRERRYETADGLARDLMRYLADEQVQAFPPSASYRLGKLVRRHKVAISTAGIVALALLAGFLVSGWQAIRATRAEAQARTSESRALAAEKDAVAHAQRAEGHARTVEGQRQKLEDNQRVNVLVTNAMLDVLHGSSVPQGKRRELLFKTLASLGQLEGPDRVKALLGVGHQFVRLGNYAEALTAYQSGISLDPHLADLYVARGDVYYQQKQLPEAFQDYSTAIENLRPEGPAIFLVPFARRGFIHSQEGRFDEALADFKRSYELTPAPTLSVIEKGFRGAFVAHAPFDERLHAGIRSLFDRYVADQKHTAASRIYAADGLAELALFDAARQHLEANEAGDGQGWFTYYRLGLLALQRGDPEEYRRVCRAILKRVAASPQEEFPKMWSVTAQLCIWAPGAAGDCGEVIRVAKLAIHKEPNSSYCHSLLGAACFRAGQWEQAHQEFDSSGQARSGNNGEQLWRPYFVAMTHFRQGKRQEAEAAWLKAEGIRKNTDFLPHNWRLRLTVHLAHEEARQLLKVTP